MEIFRQGIRPALNAGLSVTRVGGVGQNSRQKVIVAKVMKTLAAYRLAAEYSRFGSELALEAKNDLAAGKRIHELTTQKPTETFNSMAQQLMFDIVLDITEGELLDIPILRSLANEYAAKVDKDESNYATVKTELKSKSLMEIKR